MKNNAKTFRKKTSLSRFWYFEFLSLKDTLHQVCHLIFAISLKYILFSFCKWVSISSSLFPLQERTWLFFWTNLNSFIQGLFLEQNWISFTQGCFVLFLVELGTGDLRKKMYIFRIYIFTLRYFVRLEKTWFFIWINLNPFYPRMRSAKGIIDICPVVIVKKKKIWQLNDSENNVNDRQMKSFYQKSSSEPSPRVRKNINMYKHIKLKNKKRSYKLLEVFI